MKCSTWLGWPLALALMAWCGVAAANGRFPRAQRVVEDASDPARLALYGTYGLMTSADAGQSWQYICEGATGPFAGEAPLLELLPEGRIVLSSDTGLRGSTFPACAWRSLLEPVLPNAVLDITRSPESESTLWALISEPEINVGFHSAVQRSDDGGEHWSATERVPDGLIARGVTIDVAPSRAERVYLSGLNALGAGVLVRSDDGAQSWQAFPVPGTTSTSLPYIAAVDPSDAERLYLRSDALEIHDGELQPNDALFFSADGGTNVTRVFSRRAKLLGFALSPDATTVVLGYGDPVLFSYEVEPEQTGLYRARVADLLSDAVDPATAFEKVFAGSVTCLRWTAQGLYACLSQAEQGFELGRAADAEFSLDVKQPFEPLLDLHRVLPLSCDSDTAAATCVTDENYGWPFVCTKLEADCSYGQSAGGAGGEPSAPAPSESAGQGGAPGRAGAISQGGDAVENVDPGSVPRREKATDGGCACRVRPSTSTLDWLLIGLGLTQLARRRRWHLTQQRPYCP
ncbi:MAG TPA: hypothetical protein VIW29_07730 [Polyangiaceae bacterium]